MLDTSISLSWARNRAKTARARDGEAEERGERGAQGEEVGARQCHGHGKERFGEQVLLLGRSTTAMRYSKEKGKEKMSRAA